MDALIKELAVSLLRHAAIDFSTHGCNDVPDHIFSAWTEEQRENLSYSFHQWNENRLEPVQYEKGQYQIPDFALMDFIAHLLSETK